MENSKVHMLQENSISGLVPVAALAMPVIRKAWPRIGIKEAFPTEATTMPKITIPHLVPYILDADGVKRELPASLRGVSAVANSQKSLKATAIALPAKNVDIMPATCPVSAGYHPDPVVAVVKVTMKVRDVAGANEETVTVNVFDGKMDTRQNTFNFTVTGAHTGGHKTSDTVYGYLNSETGTIVLTSINDGDASEVAAKVTEVFIRGKVESTLNKLSTHIGYDVRRKDVDIGTGEHFDASMPIEWLTDNLAMYGIDGTLKVVDVLTDVLAQKVDIEGVDFLKESLDALVAQGVEFKRTFDVHPTGQYVGSPTDWLHEIHRVIDNLAHQLRNKFYFQGGQFVIVGNPIDTDIINGISWSVTTGNEVDGTDVSYQFGAQSRTNKYNILATQSIEPGSLYMFFVPSSPDHMTYKYYPYTFHVTKTTDGWANVNNMHVPGIMMTKRHKFFEFMGMISEVEIENNDGSLPA
jgi:hypothetical protein